MITYPDALVYSLDIFTTHSNPDLIQEFDLEALAAQLEHLANAEGLDLEVMTGLEFWAIAEPYRW